MATVIGNKQHSAVTGLMAVSAAELAPRIVERALRSYLTDTDLMKAQWESDNNVNGEATKLFGGSVAGTGRFFDDPKGERLNDALKFNEKVKKAYEAYTGMELTPDLVKGKQTTTFAHGEPGHGKSTAFMLSAHILADLLDMRLVREPSVNYKYSPNDFVFVTENLAGQNQVIDVGGIPDVTTVTTPKGEDKRMVKRLRHSLCSAVQANASMILFDDITNASPNLQDAMLSVAETGKFQDLQLEDGCCLGYTGNFGAADGTNATKLSAALKTRCSIYEVKDDVKSWCERTKNFYNDELGDCGITEFLLERHAQGECVFSVPIKSRRDKDAPYPCPRTWSKLLADLRPAVKRIMTADPNSPYMQALGGKSASILQLEIDFGSHVGPTVASDLRSWIEMRLTEAYPIARELYAKGKLEGTFANRLKTLAGNGRSFESKNNQRQFIRALTDTALNKIHAGGGTAEAIQGSLALFAYGLHGVTPLHVSEVSPGLQQIANRISLQEPAYSADEKGKPSSELVSMIVDAMVNQYIESGKAPSKEGRQQIIAAITGESITTDENSDLKMAI